MLHDLILAVAVGSTALPGISALSAAPLDPRPIHIAGSTSRYLTARVARELVMPSLRFGSPLTAPDIVMAVDAPHVHYRYGLTWETARHQFLSVSVAVWSNGQSTPEYSVVSGRTASSRKHGARSFDVPLPGPGSTIRARVTVMPDGRALADPQSLRMGAGPPCRC
jgi:hypothetical protein